MSSVRRLLVLIVLTAVVLAAIFVGDIGAAFVKKAESVPDIEPEQVAVAGTASPVRTLMETADAMADISFREVVLAASGDHVLPVDPAMPEKQYCYGSMLPTAPPGACAGSMKPAAMWKTNSTGC